MIAAAMMACSAVSCHKTDKPDSSSGPYIQIGDESYRPYRFFFFDNDEDEGIHYSICDSGSNLSRVLLFVPYAYCIDKTWDITTLRHSATCLFQIDMRSENGVESAGNGNFRSGTFRAFRNGDNITIDIDAVTGRGTVLKVKCIDVRAESGPYVIPIY